MHDRWKILAPVDLDSKAEARVQHALNLAEAIHGDLTLLYVINGRSKRAEALEWPTNAMLSRAGCDVRRVVIIGPVGETVGRYADDLGADLVTVTTGSYRWWTRPWRRSAATAIATTSDRAVCFARLSNPAPAIAFRSILCLVRLDGTDDALLRFSEKAAQLSDATLVLLHVLPEVSEGLIACSIPGVDDRPLSKEVAEQRLSRLTAGLACPHRTAIKTGSAYRALAKLARDHESGLVIAGGRDGAQSTVNPGAVLSRVSCPVISVPAASYRLFGSTAVYRCASG